MQFLLVNDDGIDSLGIQVLFNAFSDLQIVLLAPQFEQSAQAHSFTMMHPLRLRKRSEKQYYLDGTPADCTYVGLHHLAPETTVVLSGINHGANLGNDVYYSGTVAGAREGFLQNRMAFSISLLKDVVFESEQERVAVYTKAAALSKQIVMHLLKYSVCHWNINFPASALLNDEPIKLVTKPLGRRYYKPTVTKRVDHRGSEYLWIGGPPIPTVESDTDVYWCEQGYVVLTPLQLDVTDERLTELSKSLDALVIE